MRTGHAAAAPQDELVTTITEERGTAGRWPLPATSGTRRMNMRGPAVVHCVHSGGEAHDCASMSNPASVIRTFVPQHQASFLLICSPEIRSKRLFVQVTPVQKHVQPTSNSANQQK
jgi:hypothetical protein